MTALASGEWINLSIAIATVVMAAGTFYLAIVTQKLAKGAADGIKQAERHHQENLRPFCVLDFAYANDLHPFGVDFNSQASRNSIPIFGKLQNKGDGPATDVFVYLNARRGEGEDDAVRLTRPVLASGLVAAGETAGIEVQITERDIVRAWNGEKWNPTQAFHAIAGQAYEAVLEYRDVFGNPFRTVHPRGIWTPPVPNVGDPAVRAQMMVRPDRPSPIFLTGTQAVRTLADVPAPPPMPAPLDDDHQF